MSPLKLQFLLTICLLQKLIFANIIVPNHGSKYTEFIKFTRRLMKSDCIVVVSNNSTLKNEALKKFSKILPTTAIIFDINVRFKLQQDVNKDLIIVGFDKELIKKILKRVRQSFKSDTRTFLMLKNASCDTVIQDIFDVTWTIKLKEVIVMRENCDVPVIVFNPFKNETHSFSLHEEDEVEELLLFDNYHKEIIKASIFPSVPTTVKIGNEYIGVDPMVVHTIEEKLNVTIVHHEPYDDMHYGSALANGTKSGAFKELYEHQIDIAFNQVFIKYYNTSRLEFSSSIFRDRLCVVVPKAQYVPTWMAIFFSLPLLLWMFVFVVFVCTIIGLYLIRRRQAADRNNSDKKLHVYDYSFSTIFTDTNQLFCSSPYSSMISKKIYERIFIGFILIHNVLIYSLFQSSLVTVITRPPQYPNINTLEDLVKSGLHISSSSQTLSDTFNNYYGGYMDILQDRLTIIGQNDPTFDAWLTRESKFAYLVRTENALAIRSHLVKECPKIYLLAYTALKDAYFMNDFNRILLQIAENGMTDKWYNDVMLNISFGKSHRRNNDPIDHTRSFCISDLQTSFYILIAGLAISLVTFLLEILSKRSFNYAV